VKRSETINLDSRVQKTKYAIILLLVIPALAGRALEYVLSDGQMACSMMSMQEAPMYELILHELISWESSNKVDPTDPK
jgi:hypothetical protein